MPNISSCNDSSIALKSLAKVSSHLTKDARMITFASYSTFSLFDITIYIFIVGLYFRSVLSQFNIKLTKKTFILLDFSFNFKLSKNGEK